VTGYGRFIHETGDYYIGNWKNDKRHGMGKYVHCNGVIEDGSYLDVSSSESSSDEKDDKKDPGVGNESEQSEKDELFS